MDGVLVCGLSGYLFDPAVVDGALQTDVDARLTCATTARAVVAKEAEKTAYYGPDVPAGFVFLPCVHDTLSGGGKGALAFQRVLASLAATHANNGATPSARLIGLKALDVRQRVSIAVLRACADSVIQQFSKCPHAALTGERRFWGSRTPQVPPRCEDGSAY